MDPTWVRLGFIAMSCTSLIYMRSVTLAAATMSVIGWLGQSVRESSALAELTVLFSNFSASIMLVVLFFVVLQRREFDSIIQQDLRIFNLTTDRRLVARLLSGLAVVMALFCAWEYWCGVAWIYLSCIGTAVVFGIVYVYDYSINNYFGDSEYRIFRRQHARIHLDLAYFIIAISLVWACLNQSVQQTLYAIPFALFYAYIGMRYYRAYAASRSRISKKKL